MHVGGYVTVTVSVHSAQLKTQTRLDTCAHSGMLHADHAMFQCAGPSQRVCLLCYMLQNASFSIELQILPCAPE